MADSAFKQNRRKFLKTAGILTMLSNSVVGFLSKAFGQEYFSTNGQQRLNITGIYPNPEHIGAKGIHLRWLFALDKGFPNFFTIYRRAYNEKNYSENITFNEFHENGRYGENIKFSNNFSSVFDNQSTQGFLKTRNLSEELITVSFFESVEYVRLTFQNAQSFFITEFYQDKELQQVLVPESKFITVELRQEKISSISFPCQFVLLKNIQFIKSGELCGKGDWVNIKTINYNNWFENLNLNYFFSGYHNFYLPLTEPERTEAINEYKRNLAIDSNIQKEKKYINLYKGLQKPGILDLYIRGTEVYETKWGGLLNILLLSIIDPNIARIMGLYYVDTAVDSNTRYDYKIIATYGEKEYCSVVLSLGKDYDPLPEIKKFESVILEQDFETKQNDESYFLFDKNFSNYEQHGKVILKWLRPVQNVKTNPAAYFLVREPLNDFIIVANERKIKNRHNYDHRPGSLVLPIDDNVDVTLYNYADAQVKVESSPYTQGYLLAGIDLYGRVGNFVNSAVEIYDKSKPTPPVNLKIIERPINHQSKYFLTFNYGPEQYLKSPDISKFRLFRKEHALSLKQKVKFEIPFENSRYNIIGDKSKHNSLLNNTLRIFKISLVEYEIKNLQGDSINTPITDPNLFPFTSFQIIENNDQTRLPASERKKFKIRKFLSGNQFEIETNRNDITEVLPVYAYLYSNTQSLWTNATEEVNFVPPVSLEFTSQTSTLRTLSAKEISAKVIYVEEKELPRYDDAEGSLLTKTHIEIILDRFLFESGIFNEGTLRLNTHEYAIVAQASVYATQTSYTEEFLHTNNFPVSNLFGSKILIEKTADYSIIPLNSIVYVSPKEQQQIAPVSHNNIHGLIKILFKSNSPHIITEGELLIPARISDFVEGHSTPVSQDIPISVKLLSDIKSPGYQQPSEALVYISKHVRQILDDSSKAVYFRKYEMEITNHVNVEIPLGRGNESVYFSLVSEDNSSNHNLSPLSIPVQYINYLSGPPASFPLNSQVDKRYVSVPNKEGRSTILFEWQSAGNSIRYELSRALDVSILSALRAKWMLGDPSHELAPNVISFLPVTQTREDIHITNLTVNVKTGVYEATITTSLSEEDKKSFTGSRTQITYSIGSATVTRYFAVAGFVSGKILLRLITPVKTGNANKPGTLTINLELLPDFSTTDLLTNVGNLQLIGNACPEAFSMVTKVPIRENRFTDKVPGQGNGKFFYKVRSVDAAENRSGWSDCSDAIYQVDTTVPEPPIDFKVEIGDRLARLLWKNIPLTESITGIEIFRSEIPFASNTDFNSLSPQIIKIAITKEQLVVKKITSMLGNIAIPSPVIIPIVGSVESTLQSLSITIQLTGNPSNLYDTNKFELTYNRVDDDSNLMVKGIKIKQPGVLQDGIPLNVIINNRVLENDSSQFEFLDAGLEGGKDYYYIARTVKTIFSLNLPIKSSVASTKKITAIDWSVPEAPEVIISWVIENDDELIVAQEKANAKLVVASKYLPSRILINRMTVTDDSQDWMNPLINTSKGWIVWPTNNLTNSFLDKSLPTNKNYIYKVTLEYHLKKSEFKTITLNGL